MNSFYGDYHTHTVFSHGKGTIWENVRRAKEMGLREIAITDHGLSHIAFGLDDDKVLRMRETVEQVKAENPEINILLGVEANLLGRNGVIDVVNDEWGWFDIVLCGYHNFIWPENTKEAFGFWFPAMFGNTLHIPVKEKRRISNTDAYIKAIQNNPIDVITHVGLGFPCYVKEVAAAAAEYGTFIELNGKHLCFTDKEFEDMASTGVTFIANSDAHSEGRILEINAVRSLLQRTGYPIERLANYGKRPAFRYCKPREE